MPGRPRRATAAGCAAVALGLSCAPIPEEVSSVGLDTTEGPASSGSTTTGPPPTSGETSGETGTTTDGPTDTGPVVGTDTSSDGSDSSDGTGPQPDCWPRLTEVLYDVASMDDELEWVELYNPCSSPVDLGGLSLGWGGNDYVFGTMQLSGTMAPGECLVVGGPMSTPDNFDPPLGLEQDFDPDLQNSGGTADGIGLFEGPPETIEGATPLDAVIYGGSNTVLPGPSGAVEEPQVGDAPPNQSVRLTALDGPWVIEAEPMPGTCPTE